MAFPFWYIVLIPITLILGLMYLGGPILIYCTQRHAANPRLEALTADHPPLPGPVQELFDDTTRDLAKLGFTSLGAFFLPNQVPKVKALLSLFAHPRSNDLAMAASLFGKQPDGEWQVENYVEFFTRFLGGQRLLTNN